MGSKGQLIALDGTGNPTLGAATKLLVRQYGGAKAQIGVSRWDASSIFFDILGGPRDIPGATPRTLLLLYATDLAFRLRWEIEPSLAEGRTVIAAPYVEVAVAFAKATGVSSKWVKRLFAFAPAADASFRVEEADAPLKSGQPVENFLEFCFLQLRKGEGRWATGEARIAFLQHLRALEARGRCRVVRSPGKAKGA